MKKRLCPKCKSKNIIDIRTGSSMEVNPQPVYRCLDCGYEGSIIIEIEEIDKKRKKAKENDRQKN